MQCTCHRQSLSVLDTATCRMCSTTALCPVAVFQCLLSCLLLTTSFLGAFLVQLSQATSRVSSCQQTAERVRGSPAAQTSTGSLPIPQSTTRASAGASQGACTATTMTRITHSGLGTSVAARASPTHRTAERSDSHVAYRRRPSLRRVNAKQQGRWAEGCTATWGTPTRANSVPQTRLRKTAPGTAGGHRAHKQGQQPYPNVYTCVRPAIELYSSGVVDGMPSGKDLDQVAELTKPLCRCRLQGVLVSHWRLRTLMGRFFCRGVDSRYAICHARTRQHSGVTFKLCRFRNGTRCAASNGLSL